MAHKHSIYDSDMWFSIDPITRKITSESGKVILMQNDHNSERFTFAIPRYVEGHDMSLCNVVQIHFTNKSTGGRYQNDDIYYVDDLQLSPDSDDVVICSWLISMVSTTFVGSLDFIIRFACISDDAVIEYQWFTAIYSVVKIEAGIYNIDVVTNYDDRDLLAIWKQEILDHTMPYVGAVLDEAKKTLAELNEKIIETKFVINFETGDLEVISPNYLFMVNSITGNLEWEVA